MPSIVDVEFGEEMTSAPLLEARHQTSKQGTNKLLISKFDEFTMSEDTHITS